MVANKTIRFFFIEIAIFFYVVLFLYAGGVKLIDYGSFVGQLGKSPILAAHAGWIAWVVPVAEIILAAFLLVPRFRLTALYASFGLMSAFTIYVMWILTFSEKLPCACGGVLSSLHWKGHLVLNVAFLILGATAIALYRHRSNPTTSEPIASVR